jgi:hypothetical protein
MELRRETSLSREPKISRAGVIRLQYHHFFLGGWPLVVEEEESRAIVKLIRFAYPKPI